LGAALWIAAPIAVVALLSGRAGSLELAPAVPVWAPVEANVGQVSEPVDVALDWRAVPPVVAPAWGGVVQAVGIREGAALASGDTVAVIDGVSRLAWATAQPFYRPLGIDDTGPDAAALNLLLGERGLAHDEGDSVGWETITGIAGLAAQLGVPGADDVESFDPAWIVFLPVAGAAVTTIDLVLGAPAPVAGTTIAELDDQLAAARLAEVGPHESSPEEDGPVQHNPPVVARPEQELRVAGAPIALQDDRQSVAPESLPSLLPLASVGAESVRGQLSRPAAPREWVVPAAAIVAGGAGRTCVVTGAGARPTGVEVRVVGSEPGRAIVTGALSAADLVAVRPEAGLRSCG
jgi:hypothetical protein